MGIVSDYASAWIATVRSVLDPQSEGPIYGLGDVAAHDAGPARPTLQVTRALNSTELAEKKVMSTLRGSMYDRAA